MQCPNHISTSSAKHIFNHIHDIVEIYVDEFTPYGDTF